MNSIKLLLIDDNEDNRALIKIALEIATNWEIITASSGIEGINKAKSEIPDIILLDLIMPDLDGLTVHNLLKQNLFTCTIPIIFVTAMVNDKVISELEDANVNGIITKPLNPNSLASDISKMCDWHLFSDLKKNRLKNWNGYSEV
ncbi:MAG: response regulator [Waterburya sp.]